MCGIAGIFKHSGGQHPSLKHDVKNMLSVIKHRGPDESGIYVNKQLAIGNVRLSIIDIQSGQQPLADESGNFWIVFNGEIFNYQELRVDLNQKRNQVKNTQRHRSLGSIICPVWRKMLANAQRTVCF